MSIRVSVDNFVRAESDRYFSDLAEQAGGVNRWRHHRTPASVEAQSVIRLNRDTLYSTCLVDVSAGAVVTMPDAGGRYQTAMVLNRDHYITRILDRPGRHTLTPEECETAHGLVGVRTLVDPSDPADLAEVVRLQDALAVEAPSAEPFTAPEYEPTSFTATRRALLELGRGLPDTDRAFGSRARTDPVRHLIGAAAGWGGLPTDEAVYLGVEPDLPVGHHTLRVGEVPVRGFWSVSVYNREGYFEPNALGRYSVNSVTAERDADGVVTINLGGEPSAPNHIPVVEGWNYTVRLYRPGPEILDGSWTFPALDA